MTIANEIQRERISEEVAPGIVLPAEVMGIGEEREEVERRIETQDLGPQLQENPREYREDLIHERSFQRLIEKCDPEREVVVSAGIMDTGREIAETASSVVVHSISKKIVRFQTKTG